MEQKIEQLKTHAGGNLRPELYGCLLGWDQQTYMPPGGAEARGNQLALLGRLMHERATSPELGKLLEELKPYAASLDPDSDDARLVKVTARAYEKAVRVPVKHVVEFAQATTLGQQAWVEARAKSDFSIFRPHLEKIVALRQEYRLVLPEFRTSLRCPAGRLRTEHEDRRCEGHLRRPASRSRWN